MRGSLILFGSTQQNRQLHVCEIVSKELDQKVNWNYLANFPDIKIVAPLEDKKSIGIAQMREATHFLQEKPLALDVKILIINKANMLTDEAQNAFLKTLEEPPTYALILLLSKTEGGFLPTVLSRCRKIKSFDKFSESTKEPLKQELTLKHVLSLDNGNKLDWAELTAKEEKDTIIDILENWIEEGREMVLSTDVTLDEKIVLANKIDNISTKLDELENTNVGVRLALESLVLDL